MPRNADATVSDLIADPFGEQSQMFTRPPLTLLGCRFHFESNSHELLRLVDAAYAGLPAQRLPGAAPILKVSLWLSAGQQGRRKRSTPPPPEMFCGAGFLGGATGSSNFVVLAPAQRAALVVVSPQMLQFPYHTRYELIEFAVFSLASRARGLASLHGACVGRAGRGILLMGASGSGKSTLTLLSLMRGLDFLSEDSIFVEPKTLLATGVANYLHVKSDSLRWLGRSREAEAIRRSPVIRRRSGVRKFEVDLRRSGHRLAPAPLKISAVVFLSAQSAGPRPPLARLGKTDTRRRLTAAQAYAAGQPGWSAFLKSVHKVDVFELRRGNHPMESVEILNALLAPG